MRNMNWKVRLGIILMGISVWFFLAIAVIPFLDMEKQTRITGSLVALVIGEVLFWSGGLLVGQVLFRKYKSYFNPKNWFGRKVDQGED